MLTHTYVRHRSARSLVRKFLGRRRTYRDVLGDSYTEAEWTANVRRHGLWAYVSIRRGAAVIHWWCSPAAPAPDVAHMIGHELGHISGSRRLTGIDEELRADEYGDVAVEVLSLLASSRRARAARPRGRPSGRRSRRASSRAGL